MPERDHYPHGTPSWVDVSSRDLDATARFYTSVFGWVAEPAGPPEVTGGYTMFTARGKPVAGLGPHQDPTSEPAWSTYLAVDDCDKTVAEAKAAGATVAVAPMDVMTAGRLAFLIDPQGAFFGLWQAGDHKGAGIIDEPGSVCWHELVTTDLDAALDFYQRLFGWQTQTFDMGGTPYTVFRLGDVDISVGAAPLTPERGAAPNWRVTFAVADCDATVGLVTDNGGTVTSPPADNPIGRGAAFLDPQGVAVQIIEETEPP